MACELFPGPTGPQLAAIHPNRRRRRESRKIADPEIQFLSAVSRVKLLHRPAIHSRVAARRCILRTLQAYKYPCRYSRVHNCVGETFLTRLQGSVPAYARDKANGIITLR